MFFYPQFWRLLHKYVGRGREPPGIGILLLFSHPLSSLGLQARFRFLIKKALE